MTLVSIKCPLCEHWSPSMDAWWSHLEACPEWDKDSCGVCGDPGHRSPVHAARLRPVILPPSVTERAPS